MRSATALYAFQLDIVSRVDFTFKRPFEINIAYIVDMPDLFAISVEHTFRINFAEGFVSDKENPNSFIV